MQLAWPRTFGIFGPLLQLSWCSLLFFKGIIVFFSVFSSNIAAILNPEILLLFLLEICIYQCFQRLSSNLGILPCFRGISLVIKCTGVSFQGVERPLVFVGVFSRICHVSSVFQRDSSAFLVVRVNILVLVLGIP